jgi:hypothetical protein
VRNKTKLENPNPILQNKNGSRVRERRSVPTSFEKKCSLKQKHSGSHTKHSLVPTTSPLLSPSTIKKKKKGERKEKGKKKSKHEDCTAPLPIHTKQRKKSKSKYYSLQPSTKAFVAAAAAAAEPTYSNIPERASE